MEHIPKHLFRMYIPCLVSGQSYRNKRAKIKLLEAGRQACSIVHYHEYTVFFPWFPHYSAAVSCWISVSHTQFIVICLMLKVCPKVSFLL